MPNSFVLDFMPIRPFLDQLRRDAGYAVRTLMRNPAFSLVAIVCLGLGIGASTTIFSVVNAVLLKDLPFKNSSRLLRVYTEFPTFPGGGLPKFPVSAPEFRELQRDGRSWDQLEAWTAGGANISGTSEPVRVPAAFVSGGLMAMLGVQPAKGRFLTLPDDVSGAPMTVVLSDGLWRRAFGSDSNVVGRETYLNGAKATVVGVMPPGFEFPPGANEPSEVWAPLQLTAQQMTRRGGHFLSLIGHLRPGLSFEDARRETVQLVTSYGEKASPNFHSINPKTHPVVIHGFQDEVVGTARKPMLMLLGAVGFFLLIACVNVANLLLARSDARQREIAVREAIGAGQLQLTRQFIVEGTVLASAGAVLGLFLAWAGVKLIIATNAGMIPRIREASVDGSVLVFSIGVALITGVAFGLAPLVHLVTRSLHDALKAAARTQGSSSSNRFRSVLVMAELAMALVLLIGAGLLVRAFWKLQAVHPGFDSDRLITMRLSLSNSSYDPVRLRQFWSSLADRLANTPGLESATIMQGLPPERQAVQNDTVIENFVPRPGGPVQNVAFYQSVGDRFFETLRVPLIDGRFFDARDGFGAPGTVIVNETMARSFWPGEPAIGKRIRPAGAADWLTIVGVVKDVKNGGLDKPAGTEIFLPARQGNNAARNAYVVGRTAGDPLRAVHVTRELIRELDPSLPVTQVRTMSDVLWEAQSRPRFLTVMLALFSTLALALAAFGIYGVISYSVSQRTAEFGIRMAIGAQQTDVLRLVMREAGILAAAGILLGAAGGLLLGRFLEGMLFDTSRFDVGTFSATSIVLAVATLLACWVPARRATQVDPIKALRYE